MSTIKVTNLTGRNGSPTLPDGAVVTGVATATTFDGNLKSTGTPTLGLGVTINSSGLHITGVTTVGVVTGGTFYGSGSNLTGVGETTAPWHYDPDVNDTNVTIATGIGITFNKKINSGSGTATLKIVNAGAAGTTIQSWGVSSCTFKVTELTFGALVSNLTVDQTYQLDIPEGFLTDSSDVDYVGTAYTFTVTPPENKLFSWGRNDSGQAAQEGETKYSSPTQIPGTTYKMVGGQYFNSYWMPLMKTTGELFMVGYNNWGNLGDGNRIYRSSPVQVGTETTWSECRTSEEATFATKTDGTLWGWGWNQYGNLGQNSQVAYSSPVQVTSATNWKTTNGFACGYRWNGFINTSGELYMTGEKDYGVLGQNEMAVSVYSSPIQVPGTTWSQMGGANQTAYSIRTDGTLWAWGRNTQGELGINEDENHRSSPIQIPGTTWSYVTGGREEVMALKTDGTLWAWGQNEFGQLAQNDVSRRSSPVQIPGTTWSKVEAAGYQMFGIKTDGSLWGWGRSIGSANIGNLGLNSDTQYSSPVQIGSDVEWDGLQMTYTQMATINDQTP